MNTRKATCEPWKCTELCVEALLPCSMSGVCPVLAYLARPGRARRVNGGSMMVVMLPDEHTLPQHGQRATHNA